MELRSPSSQLLGQPAPFARVPARAALPAYELLCEGTLTTAVCIAKGMPQLRRVA